MSDDNAPLEQDGSTLPISEAEQSETFASNSLLPQHLKRIQESGICEEVMRLRGYTSVKSKAELKRRGFADAQALTPTLLIPIFSPLDSKEPALLHHRPDNPRMVDGKPNKYEFPKGSSMVVDAHPIIHQKVRDPRIPLFITEGVRKADSAISQGICCLAIVGVWNWRGKNEYGGLTLLPEWDAVAFKGKDKQGNTFARPVYLCYDSDVMQKMPVYQALMRLASIAKAKGGAVRYIYLPSQPDGSKTGLDDYLAAGHSIDELLALAQEEPRKPPTADPKPSESAETDDDDEPLPVPYAATRNGLVYYRNTPDGTVPVALTNFTAQIVADIIEDDGAETTQTFEIRAHLGGQPTSLTVPATEFAGMNWALRSLGARAIVYAGMSIKDHTRVAIQSLSQEIISRRVYKHTGWRQHETGQWMYLHANGAIGANADEHIEVCLADTLAHYALPEPPKDADLPKAVYAFLDMGNLGPQEVCLPLLAAVCRAVLCSADFSLHLAGPSGAFKSELAALAQQCFGSEFSSRRFPAAWSSTDNALEACAFLAKDALFVVDDFVPRGSANDVQRLHAKADRLLRGQGNNAGRQRLRADSTLRTTRFPRGLILSTGEDIPTGQSLRGRMLILEVAQGDISSQKLTVCQQHAKSGLYAQALSGFIAWLAPDYLQHLQTLRDESLHIRAKVQQEGQHRRAPDIVGHLLAGFRLFLTFARQQEMLTEELHTQWNKAMSNALLGAAGKQAQHQAAAEPAQRFLELLKAVFAAGKAHLTDCDADMPFPNPERWGWRQEPSGAESVWKQQGERIGWIDEEDVYLLPDPTYKAIKAMGGDIGEGISISATSLWKRLKERGWLATTDTARQTNSIRRTFSGVQENVLHLGLPLLLGEPDNSDIPDRA